MDYRMVMPVCDSITLDKVSLRTRQGVLATLPVEAAFALRKAYIHSGGIAARPSGFWQLEAQLDQSLLVAFGYIVHADGSVKPLPEADVARLGDWLMPSEHEADKPNLFVVDRLATTLHVGPVRVILTFSLTCCKERADFEPGGVIGANRIYPHVMVTCSDEVSDLSATIAVKRPARSMHSGAVSADTYADHMLPDLGGILFTDSNTPTYTFPGAPVLPFWDRVFDYYDTDPFSSGTGRQPLVMVDPARQARVLTGALRKAPPSTTGPHKSIDLVKQARQGAFDSIHIAPKMRLSPNVLTLPTTRTDNIPMAPFCVHDCLHTHFRWGKWSGWEFPWSTKNKWALGFDEHYEPYSTEAAPLVPHDQKVIVTFSTPSSFTYDAKVVGKTRAGRTTVFFHHGMSYANDEAAPQMIALARGSVETFAQGNKEHVFPPPVTASTSWAALYWRLRFGGTQNNPVERLQVPNLAAAVAF